MLTNVLKFPRYLKATVINHVTPPPLFSCIERDEVHTFLCANMDNGGILELLMRYLKVMGQKFLDEWPSGLTTVVLEIYNCWRRHSAGLPNPLLRDSNNKHIKVSKNLLSIGTLCLRILGGNP